MEDAVRVYRGATTTMHHRSREEINALLSGLEVARPGVVWLSQWRPDPDTGLDDAPGRSLCYAAVARKP
jgi:hypothetical protein